MHAGQLLFKSTPAGPCKDHLILVENARSGWRGATATNCVGLALNVTFGCGPHSAVVGDAITIGDWGGAAAAALPGWICSHASLSAIWFLSEGLICPT